MRQEALSARREERSSAPATCARVSTWGKGKQEVATEPPEGPHPPGEGVARLRARAALSSAHASRPVPMPSGARYIQMCRVLTEGDEVGALQPHASRPQSQSGFAPRVRTRGRRMASRAPSRGIVAGYEAHAPPRGRLDWRFSSGARAATKPGGPIPLGLRELEWGAGHLLSWRYGARGPGGAPAHPAAWTPAASSPASLRPSARDLLSTRQVLGRGAQEPHTGQGVSFRASARGPRRSGAIHVRRPSCGCGRSRAWRATVAFARFVRRLRRAVTAQQVRSALRHPVAR